LKELVFIGYGGLIRGAIAFALVLHINEGIKDKSVIITTTLILVVITTVFFGGLMPLVQSKLLTSEVKAAGEEHHGHG
jgi:NhaP-type Na+/H+ or K+/H+ antiporter